MHDIDTIRKEICKLDQAERHGENVTVARAYWCKQAVDWAKARLQWG